MSPPLSRPLPIGENDLHAYADGQLSDERRQAVQQWLAGRPDDAARVEAYRLLGEQWRSAYAPVLREPVPESLSLVIRQNPGWRRLPRFATALAAQKSRLKLTSTPIRRS